MNKLAAILAAALVVTACDGPTGHPGQDGQQGARGFNWAGTWSAATTYQADDAVSHQGQSWVAVRQTVGTAPPSADWQLVAAKGEQGLQGVQGVQGVTGPIGPQGEQGVIGPQGVQGVVGPTGPQGAQGLQGVIGPQGIQGVQGVVGPQGIRGEVGPQGSRGVNWVGAWSDTAVYLADDGVSYQGASYVATGAPVTGVAPTTGAWLLLASRGDVGPTGPQGEQGLQGIQGIQGLKGDQGLQGLKGDQGLQGEVGPQGLIGLTGLTGMTGMTGMTGPTGPIGPSNGYVALSMGTINVVAANTTTVVTTPDLPVGLYLITYSGTLINGANTSSVAAECKLQANSAGNTLDVSNSVVSIPALGYASFSGVGYYSSDARFQPLSISVACQQIGVPSPSLTVPGTVQTRIIAVRVGSLN